MKYVFENFIGEKRLIKAATDKLLGDCDPIIGFSNIWRHADGSLLFIDLFDHSKDPYCVVKAIQAGISRSIPGCQDLIYNHLPNKVAETLRKLSPCLSGLLRYWRNQEEYHKYWASGEVSPESQFQIARDTFWLRRSLFLDEGDEPLILELLGVEVVK
jgi:hypothetical protein